MADVVALGELLIDFTMDRTDEAGYPTMTAHPGGAPANYLAALSKYGISTAFIGKVGDDYFGRLLKSTLEGYGIQTKGLIVDADCFTTLAFVTLDGRGERSFSFARKPGADICIAPEEIDYTIIDEARVLHFGSLSLTDEPARSSTRAAVDYAKGRRKLISFDPNLREPLWDDMNECRDQMLWGLLQADIVKISDDEVSFLFGCGPEEGAEKLLGEYQVGLVMVTMASKGAYITNGKGGVHIPAINAAQIDSTGAGDIFGGAAMSRLLRYAVAPEELDASDLYDIGCYANAAAGISVERPGGMPSIPDNEEVISRMAEKHE